MDASLGLFICKIFICYTKLMNKIAPQSILIAILILGFGIFFGYSLKQSGEYRGETGDIALMDYVIDGDTIKLVSGERVRLIGIDAPEKEECYYKESKAALEDAIGERQIRLDKDVEGIDRVGRFLRYVIALSEDPKEDNIHLNDYMLRHGYAKRYSEPENKLNLRLYIAAENEAQREKRGIWNECEIEEVDTQALREQDAEPPNESCIIKGNISEKGYGMTYLFPGCANYDRVKIDTRKGERYFCTKEEAEEVGFREAENCP